jgi:hypothetical protein
MSHHRSAGFGRGSTVPLLWPDAGRQGLADPSSWAGPKATVGSTQVHNDIFLLPFQFILNISNRFKPSKINSNSNKFDKKMKSSLLIDFKYNL